jgi:hypothetical protein
LSIVTPRLRLALYSKLNVSSIKLYITFFSKKNSKPTSHLPSLYCQAVIKAEHDYRREIRHKFEQLQRENRGTIRRRLATDHVFVRGLLTKRHKWLNIDKSYRDACRATWDRQRTESGRTSHLFLPSVYSSDSSSSITMTSFNTVGSYDEDEDPAITDARIERDFLLVQPVLLELMCAPHSSKILKYKQEIQLRKKSAQKRQIQIQTTATTDKRFTRLLGSLQETNSKFRPKL